MKRKSKIFEVHIHVVSDIFKMKPHPTEARNKLEQIRYFLQTRVGEKEFQGKEENGQQLVSILEDYFKSKIDIDYKKDEMNIDFDIFTTKLEENKEQSGLVRRLTKNFASFKGSRKNSTKHKVILFSKDCSIRIIQNNLTVISRKLGQCSFIFQS